MTAIYVDPSAAAVPDAADHLAHLLETGHELFLVGDSPEGMAEALPGATRIGAVPADADRQGWYVTADPQVCADRHGGIRTLLVGPRAAVTARPLPRCDAEARDLAAAVLEILSRDAMG